MGIKTTENNTKDIMDGSPLQKQKKTSIKGVFKGLKKAGKKCKAFFKWSPKKNKTSPINENETSSKPCNTVNDEVFIVDRHGKCTEENNKRKMEETLHMPNEIKKCQENVPDDLESKEDYMNRDKLSGSTAATNPKSSGEIVLSAIELNALSGIEKLERVDRQREIESSHVLKVCHSETLDNTNTDSKDSILTPSQNKGNFPLLDNNEVVFNENIKFITVDSNLESALESQELQTDCSSKGHVYKMPNGIFDENYYARNRSPDDLKLSRTVQNICPENTETYEIKKQQDKKNQYMLKGAMFEKDSSDMQTEFPIQQEKSSKDIGRNKLNLRCKNLSVKSTDDDISSHSIEEEIKQTTYKKCEPRKLIGNENARKSKDKKRKKLKESYCTELSRTQGNITHSSSSQIARKFKEEVNALNVDKENHGLVCKENQLLVRGQGEHNAQTNKVAETMPGTSEMKLPKQLMTNIKAGNIVLLCLLQKFAGVGGTICGKEEVISVAKLILDKTPNDQICLGVFGLVEVVSSTSLASKICLGVFGLVGVVSSTSLASYWLLKVKYTDIEIYRLFEWILGRYLPQGMVTYYSLTLQEVSERDPGKFSTKESMAVVCYEEQQNTVVVNIQIHAGGTVADFPGGHNDQRLHHRRPQNPVQNIDGVQPLTDIGEIQIYSRSENEPIARMLIDDRTSANDVYEYARLEMACRERFMYEGFLLLDEQDIPFEAPRPGFHRLRIVRGATVSVQ